MASHGDSAVPRNLSPLVTMMKRPASKRLRGAASSVSCFWCLPNPFLLLFLPLYFTYLCRLNRTSPTRDTTI